MSISAQSGTGFPQKHFKLSQLAQAIKRLIDSQTGEYWITAEVVKLNYYPIKGYANPELAEKEGDTVVAQMRATIWREQFNMISRKFREVTGEDLQDGMHILFRGFLTYHPVYGLSVNIRDIEPAFTLGEMARKRLEAIARLKKEDIFGKNRSISFPLIPKRLAVISVQTSKGFSDFLRIISENPAGYVFETRLFSAVMQGEKAAASIMEQLQVIKEIYREFDVVLMIRGGGDDTGLSCYDNYDLARSIALFPLPVITGVGHSTNETVCEMVSAINKITPTDAAYFLIGRFADEEHRANEAIEQIMAAGKLLLENHFTEMRNLSGNIVLRSRGALSSADRLLVVRMNQMSSRSMEAVRKQHQSFRNVRLRAGKAAHRMFRLEAARIATCSEDINRFPAKLLSRSSERLEQIQVKIRILDPINMLNRGYSITLYQGVAVTDPSLLPENAEVMIRMARGEANARIMNVNDHE